MTQTAEHRKRTISDAGDHVETEVKDSKTRGHLTQWQHIQVTNRIVTSEMAHHFAQLTKRDIDCEWQLMFNVVNS